MKRSITALNFSICTKPIKVTLVYHRFGGAGVGDYHECGSHRKEKKGDEEPLISFNCDGLLQTGKV